MDNNQTLIGKNELSNNESKQLAYAIKEIKTLQNENLELKNQYNELSAKTQATADFSDDLVTTSGNLMATVESRIDKSLNTSNMVLSHADSLISTYLVIISLVIAVVGTVGSLWLQRSLAKSREQHLHEAIVKLTEKLSKDRGFQKEFMQALATHTALSDNINTAIDTFVQENLNKRQGSTKTESCELQEMSNDLELGEA